MQTRTGAAHGIADSLDGLILSDDAAVEFLLEMEQFFALALQHTRHGNAGPAAHHLCDVVGGHLLTHHGVAVLCLFQLRLDVLNLALQLLQFAVAYFCHEAVVALALSTLRLKLQRLNLLLVLLDAVDEFLLALPFRLEGIFLLAQFGNVVVELCQFGLVVLTADGLALYLELGEPA